MELHRYLCEGDIGKRHANRLHDINIILKRLDRKITKRETELAGVKDRGYWSLSKEQRQWKTELGQFAKDSIALRSEASEIVKRGLLG